jgi:hypothetical protein
MPLVVFFRFPELAFEIRSRIWEYAIISYLQDTTNRLPPWLEDPRVKEQQRPLSTTALRVCISDPYDGLKLRFEEEEFETLVDHLLISAACYEARVCVAQYCQPLVSHVYCEYTTYPIWSLQPPKRNAQPVTIRNLHCQPESLALKYFCPQPTTLTIEMGRFKSAKHFVEVVLRFFGKKIQRLVMVQVVRSVDYLQRAYWAESGVLREENKM